MSIQNRSHVIFFLCIVVSLLITIAVIGYPKPIVLEKQAKLSACTYQETSGEEYSKFSLWNSFIGMVNIVELNNNSFCAESLTLHFFKANGSSIETLNLELQPGEQRDIILNDLTGYIYDSYGLIEIRTASPDVSGRVSYYRPAANAVLPFLDETGQRFDFVFNAPLTSGLSGDTVVPFNTYQPSLNVAERNDIVANWLTLVNIDSKSRLGLTIEKRDQLGQLIRSDNIILQPSERLDYEAGHEVPGPSNVGLIRILPDDKSRPYLAQLMRYGYKDNGSSFSFAIMLTPQQETSNSILLPIRKEVGTEIAVQNFLEVANTGSETSTIDILLRGENGAILDGFQPQLILAPYAQQHFDMSSELGSRGLSSGSVELSAKNNENLTAISMFYFRDTARGSIDGIFGSQATDAAANINSSVLSWNRFLGMDNYITLINTTANPLISSIEVWDQHQQQNLVTINLSGYGSTTLAINDPSFRTNPNSYGTIAVPPELKAELLRFGIREKNNTGKKLLDFVNLIRPNEQMSQKDICREDPNKEDPGICGCGIADTDSDSDGSADCIDQCPSQPNKVSPGVCGCGIADTDSDSDGSADCIDQCPSQPNKISPGICGCGILDEDSNYNGVIDCKEIPRDSSRENLFFDSTNNKYWRFAYSESKIIYESSANQQNWTKVGALSYNSPNFATSYKNIGNIGYIFLAIEANNYDIVLRRGKLGDSSIEFDQELTTFKGSSTSDKYSKPNIALDANNHIWVASIKDFGTDYYEHLQAQVRRSVNVGNADITQFDTQKAVGRKSYSLTEAVILPQKDSQMYLLLSTDSANILGYRFNGSTWSMANEGGDYSWLTFGSKVLSGAVYAVAISGNRVFLGGAFDEAFGIKDANGIIKWDGSTWQALGTGINDGYVETIAVSGSNVYVAGDFRDAGGNSDADYIARWDGSTWHSLGTGSTINYSYSGGMAIAIKGQDLFLCGKFKNIGGLAEGKGLARWDGTQWQTIGNGLDFVTTCLASDSDLYVGGSFTNAGGVEGATGVARWDGSKWHALGTGLDQPTDTYKYVYPYVSSLAIYRGNLIVGGSFSKIGTNTKASYIAQFDGTNWSSLGDGLNSSVRSIVAHSDYLYVGGSFSNAGGVEGATGVARWDGSKWSAVGDGFNSSDFISKIGVSDDYFFALGSFNPSSSSDFVSSNVVELNSGHWKDVRGTIKPMINGKINQINTKGEDAYLVGSFKRLAGVNGANYVARFDGTNWYDLSNGLNGEAYTVHVANNNIYVGGQFTNAGGNLSAARIARYDGTSWHSLGEGLNGNVVTIAALGSDVYAAGHFTNAGGNDNADAIARFDGSSWHALGAEIKQSTKLIASNGSIYSMGANYFPSNNSYGVIYRWDGTKWHVVPEDAETKDILLGYPTAMGIFGTNYYVGGYGLKLNRDGAAPEVGFLWDGAKWQNINMGTPNYSFYSFSSFASFESNVYFAGSFRAQSPQFEDIMKWDGSSLQKLGDSWGKWQTIYDIAVSEQTDRKFFSVYSFTSPSGQVSKNFVIRTKVVAKDASNMSARSVLADSDSNIHMLYTDTNQSLYYRKYSYAKQSWEPALVLSSGKTTDAALVLNRESTLLTATWRKDGTFHFHRGSVSSFTSNP